MFENLKLFRNWYRFAKPNKKLWFFSATAVVLAYVTLLIAPLFSAKVVICMTDADYLGAVIYLSVVFGLLLLRQLFLAINYKIYAKLLGSIYCRFNNLFVDKMLNAKPENFEKTSKEKLLNIINTDTYDFARVADYAVFCLGRIVMLIATIIIIFCINVWVGVAVIVMDIINFALINYLENKRAKRVKKLREDHDLQYQKFGEIVENRDTINDLKIQNKLKKQYNKILDNYIKDLDKKTMADNSVTQGFYAFYNFVIFVLTLGMVLLTSWGTLSVEMYFIIVPYITNGIETTNLVFEFMPYLKNSAIYSSRIKTVLDFVEKDTIEVGDISTNNVIGFMEFDNLSYKGDKNSNSAIKKVNLKINGFQTTLIVGTKNSGKQTLFSLMKREIKATHGELSLDGLNVLEYSKNVYGKNFSYVTPSQTFFNGSIM